MATDDLTAEQIRDLRALAGAIIPSSTVYDVPGADDEQDFRGYPEAAWSATATTYAARWRILARFRKAPSPTSERNAVPKWPACFGNPAARRWPRWSGWCCFAIIATTG